MPIINQVVKGGGAPAPVINALNVVPSTSSQTITAPTGVDGYSPINVSAVTSSIDANIVSGNIKDGVSILGVTGSFIGDGAASINPFNLDSSGNVTKRSISLTPTTFDGVVSIGNGAMQHAYYNNTGISGALVMGQLVSVGVIGLNATFTGCQNISSASFPCLVEVNTRGFENAFDYNYIGSSMASARFYSLKNIGPTAFNGAFAGCGGVEVYFDAVRPTTFSSYTNQFNNMFNNTGNNGATIHFPSNMQATVETLTGYPNFGANSGKLTILYDLPATVVLTGADTVNYERNPVADTSTALSWRVDGTNAKSTPYYTSGTSDPVIGDTIYSDAACTTAVTTISSIA